jgi:signal transduction histidine kinase
MADRADLLRVPAFSQLPEDQITWFLENSRELVFKAGEAYWRQGDPADEMFVLLEGQIHIWGELNGAPVAFDVVAGEITGTLPFSRMKNYPVNGRALTDGRGLRFPATLFTELVYRMPTLAQHLVGLMSDRIREFTRREYERDRLAALGKLSAGLAHELNNPASAAGRAANQMRATLKCLQDASQDLGGRELTASQKAEIEALEASLIQQNEPPPDTLTASLLEENIEAVLRKHRQNDLWELAADLARRNAKPEIVESFFSNFDAGTARAALVRIAASLDVTNLLHEIESSTSRISDLVRAIKEYTFMDQAPIQNVDVVKSVENTLTIMNHKLKKGVTVQRDYQRVPLLVNSFGSELNQVWTNLIDNAVDAMNGQGELRVRVYREDDCVVVSVGDNGPGIPTEIQQRIFEPFFTTKGVGEGTGLGLDTVQRIVSKHKGNVRLRSKPGDTRFEVRLPMSRAS